MKRTLFVLAALAVASAIANAQATLPNTPVVPGQLSRPLPPPNPAVTQEMRIIHADEWANDGKHLDAKGDVQVVYRGYTMRANRVVGDLRTEVFTLIGSAQMEGENTFVEGDRVIVDFRQRTYTYDNGEAVIPPERSEGNMTGNLYVKANHGTGTPKTDDSLGVDVTTCDLDNPHYRLDAKDSEFVADKYIKMHDVKVIVLGKTLFTLPFLYIPLKEDASRLVPEFGEDDTEGYYAKFRYFVPIGSHDLLIAHYDYLSKLGQGLGGDYKYETPNASGVVSAYGVFGSDKTVTANIDHQQRLGKGQLSIDATLQNNNYLTAPNSTYLTARSQYQIQTDKGSYRLGYSVSNSQSSEFSSSNQNLQFSQQSQWNKWFNSSLDLNYTGNNSDSGGVSTSSSQRLDVNFKSTADVPAVRAEFDYQRAVPIGGGQNFSVGNDRTPDLTLTTDMGKLSNNKQPPNLLGLKLEAGELGDDIEGHVTRYDFDSTSQWQGNKGKLQYSADGRFNQGMYSDDTAQYVLSYDGRLAYNYGGSSTFGVSYNKQRQFGFTPLATDVTGRNDLLNVEWTHQPNQQTRIGLTTAYDFEQASQGNPPWQSLSLIGQIQRNPDTHLEGTVLYDTFNNVWSSISLTGGFKLGESKWQAGVRYDGSRSQWAGANLQVQGFNVGKVSADAFFGYNGYTQQLEAQQYNLRYDLHCWEAVLQYTDNEVGFLPGKTVGFFLRIKALPFTNNFGVGTRGQNLFQNGGLNY